MKKIIVVTGASSGMGKEFVLQISRKVTVDEIWVIARSELPAPASSRFLISTAMPRPKHFC